MSDNTQACRHEGINWNGEGECITCARDKVLRDNTQAERHSTDTCQPDLVECVLEELVRGVEYANHRYYADKPITGSQYDKIVDKDVSEAKQAILDWRNKQIEALLNEMLVDVSSPSASIDQAEMVELINLYVNKIGKT